MSAPRRLHALTGVRFLFALGVVLHHQGASNGLVHALGLSSAPRWIANPVHAGYTGVSFFFVLSGFVLAWTYRDLAPSGVRAYAVARAARVLPLHALGLLLAAPFLVRRHVAIEGVEPAAWVRLAGESAVWATLTQAWIPPLALTGNHPAWSLSAEAFFYATLPLWIGGVRRASSARLVASALGLAALALAWTWAAHRAGLAGISGLVATGADAARGDVANALRFLPPLRLPEFVIGGIAGELVARGAVGARARAWSLPVGGGLLALAVVGLADHLPYLPVHSGGLALPCALMVVGLTADGPVQRALGSAPAQRLGEASYAVYLLHVPLWWIVGAVDERALGLAGARPGLVLVLYLGGLTAVSLAAFRWVEEPARRWVRRRWG